METLPARPVRAEQTSPQGGSGAAALGGPKKPTRVYNGLDMPTSLWSEMAKKSGEPLLTRTANDDRHPSVDTSWVLLPKEAQRVTTTDEYCQAAWWRLLRCLACGPALEQRPAL